MEAYNINPPLWDLSQVSTFSQLPEEDFLALIQKQYPTTLPDNALDYSSAFATYEGGAINPQSLNAMGLPALTPPSDDSSPSPPADGDDDDNGGNDLKRKASDDDFEQGHSSKTQNTVGKKGAAVGNTKRKTSNGSPEESRLLKRKEQNRAAQRAFRERKEKHVKDLEDKVAALEERNTQATSENENLRDLLTRLQNENMALKQSPFTFSVPKNAASVHSPASSYSAHSSSLSPQSPYSAISPPRMTNLLDMSSLTAFDPSVLKLLEDTSTTTATSAGSQMANQYGYGDNGGHFPANVTTIASNPMFLSLSSLFDDPMTPIQPQSQGQSSNNSNSNPSPASNTQPSPYDFDMSSLSPWPGMSANQGFSDNALDDLFPDYMNMGGAASFYNGGMSSISPIIHHQSPQNIGDMGSSSHLQPSLSNNDRRPSSASTSSASASASPQSHAGTSSSPHDSGNCPKTKAEARERLQAEGPSPFAPMPSNINGLSGQKFSHDGNGPMSGGMQDYTSLINSHSPSSYDMMLGPMAGGLASNLQRFSPQFTPQSIACMTGVSKLPHTDASEQNVEVLSAWKSIRANPHYKDCDINQLCHEFSSKAKCDGSKVVLEPQGVNQILEGLSNKGNNQNYGHNLNSHGIDMSMVGAGRKVNMS